jgi:phenylacetic acid degradation operon negative regulatory protein
VLQKKPKTVTPRKLIMSLFNAPDNDTLTIGQLINVGSLFEIEAPTIRMAVTRLIKDQLIDNPERGRYRAGEKAANLNSEIQSWRNASKKTAEWNGDWLITLTNHLGRTNKTQLRSMVRAFQLYGFVEIETGVWLRPANLVQGVDIISENFIDLGMDSRVILVNATKVADERHTAWRAMWPVADLEANYQDLIIAMEKSLGRLDKMSNHDAAKESFIIGESAIRLINLDPLLPKEIINTALFEKVVATMITYDDAGQAYWQDFLSS